MNLLILIVNETFLGQRLTELKKKKVYCTVATSNKAFHYCFPLLWNNLFPSAVETTLGVLHILLDFFSACVLFT